MAEAMRDYELVVLYHPDLEIDLEKPLKKVEGIITGQKGSITKTDNWGKRKLAYPIKKQDYAIYVYYEISVPAESVAKIENALNIANEVVRYLITQPVPEVPEEDSDSSDDKESTTDETASEESDDSEEAKE